MVVDASDMWLRKLNWVRQEFEVSLRYMLRLYTQTITTKPKPLTDSHTTVPPNNRSALMDGHATLLPVRLKAVRRGKSKKGGSPFWGQGLCLTGPLALCYWRTVDECVYLEGHTHDHLNNDQSRRNGNTSVWDVFWSYNQTALWESRTRLPYLANLKANNKYTWSLQLPDSFAGCFLLGFHLTVLTAHIDE